jgi:acyl-coenzyme A thioesterase PaaI-like protein
MGSSAGFADCDYLVPFEQRVGPFKVRHSEGGLVTGFLTDPRHDNGRGHVAGGALVVFADFSLFAFAHSHLNYGLVRGGRSGPSVITVSFDMAFSRPIRIGEMVTARARRFHLTPKSLFVRASLHCGQSVVSEFGCLFRRIQLKDPDPGWLHPMKVRPSATDSECAADALLGPYRILRGEPCTVYMDPETSHCNDMGTVHGGALLSLAEKSMVAATSEIYPQRCALIRAELERPGRLGFESGLKAQGRQLCTEGNATILAGEISDDECLMTYSGVLLRDSGL